MFECFNCFDIYGILSFDWHLPIKNRSRGRGPKFNFRKPIFCQLLSDHSYLPHYINFTIFVPKPYIKAVRYLSLPIAGFLCLGQFSTNPMLKQHHILVLHDL